jgi:hypothetical protein
MLALRELLLTTIVVSVVVGTQTRATPEDAILERLIGDIETPLEPDNYPTPLRGEVIQLLARASAYRPATPAPPGDGLQKMVYAARISYEHRLVAVAEDMNASTLARGYVDALKPCYEWEGYHDCPEREAAFADKYQAEHPTGPFSDFLPLLSAHRWLCAAEAYEYERQPAEAERSRTLSATRLAAARSSRSMLVRIAAARLKVRGQCGQPLPRRN